LAEAQQRFQVLADAGNTSAEGMASAAITESGDCLLNLGRLNEATAAYEEAIKRDENRHSMRDVAVGKAQLGGVLMFQRRYAEALEIYVQARAIFETLGEPKSVATICHQIGMVYREDGHFEQAERAYRQSLAINVQQKDLAGEASTLSELSYISVALGRLEEAVKWLRQAADIYVKLQDQRHEGSIRNNLGITLVRLKDYDEARRELLRAIECNKPYGHAAQLWSTWSILYELEKVTGHAEAAAKARQQSTESYLAYRRDGGQSMEFGARLCGITAKAIEQEDATELEELLTQFSGTDASPSAKIMISKLQAILRGDRNPALADDPNLDFDDAVELQLLLEALGAK